MEKANCEKCKWMWYDDRSPFMCRNPRRLEILEDVKGYHTIPFCGNLNPNGYCSEAKHVWWKWIDNIFFQG